ncbi:DUF5694 domain-containing protein [Pedobacter foliorum]|uniref:DUF5694 domain-containing protein n=1 Tax=Pedobacter foliorum TaxID=2739058 RepID=UPI0015666847|nr:DUF5694 domain-containing protein [Pedobacter foliorum]NRF40674.1 hypothetical protein [Pedobacter foliorum]
MFQKLFTSSILLLFFLNSFSQDKINVILIGTFHFNNPGNDAAKTNNRDMLSKENQLGLEQITDLIVKKYKPDQIFVESNYNKKRELNDNYQLYLKDKFSAFTDTIKNARMRKLYTEGETFQLAFRLAKKAKNEVIYPIDTLIELRFDLLQKLIKSDAKLSQIFKDKVANLSKKANYTLAKKDLKEVFKDLNTDKDLNENKGFYISFANSLGINENYFGANLVSDWYKRNLIMYSNVQNQLISNTKNIVILVGTGHAAMFKDFIKNDEKFNLIELKTVL